MARLPTKAEVERSKAARERQRPKQLAAIGIDAAKFDAILRRLEDECSLSLAGLRSEIIEACYQFDARMVQASDSTDATEVRAAKRQLEKFQERLHRKSDPLAALTRLRTRWVHDAALSALWGELECDLGGQHIFFLEGLCRFHADEVPVWKTNAGMPNDISARIRVACKECIAFWNTRSSLRRSRPVLGPLRDWILHLAVVYEAAGGNLAKSWASWRGDLSRDHSPFVAFLLPLVSILRPICRRSDAALADYVRLTGEAVRAGKLKKVRPYYFL